ncbi:MAG: hypothetical protein IPH08_15270 [Rhodocyclaceae bacterium]|nr:hypothetical protein [Rhodocyclaceae bacterium]MBK6908362.1 hypothetical protein [Rhodocyclaceae bacterium]
MNRTSDSPVTLGANAYVFGPPDWLKQILRWVLIALACLPVAFAGTLNEQLEVAQFLGLLGLSAGLVLLAQSRSLQLLGVCFVADTQGLRFAQPPRLFAETPDLRECWLLVPWPNVNAMRTDEMLAGENGMAQCVALTLSVSAFEEHLFFSHLVSPWHRERHGNGQLTVRYHSGLITLGEALSQLQALRSGQCTVQDTPAAHEKPADISLPAQPR